MTIEFSCSHCDKVLKTSDDKAGRRAKCPQCGEPITVPNPEVETSHDEGFDGFDEFDESESPVSEEQSFLASDPIREEDSFLAGGTVDCPMCGATLEANAKKCAHCGETLKASRSKVWGPRIISVGDVFSRSWELYKQNMGLCIGASCLAMMLYIFGAIGVSIIQLIFNVVVINVVGQELLAVLVIPFGLLTQFAVYLILFYLQLGVQSVFLQIIQGRDPGIGELFSGWPFLWRMVLCSLVFSIVTVLGYILLIIPGIILVLMFWPYSYLLIDRDLPGIESFTESRKITSGNKLSMFLINLASFGIGVFGTILTLGIGAIFVFPYLAFLQGVAYAEMTNQ